MPVVFDQLFQCNKTMIKITDFFNEIRIGSSLPLIVGGSDGNKYVVKLNGSGDGVIASVIDWLSIQIGQLLSIPVLQSVFLEIDNNFIKEDQDPEIIELVEKSNGLNFGTHYEENTQIYHKNNGVDVSKSLKSRIFLFDLFLLNIDRTPKNPNIIYRDHELWCLDFSSSITMRSSIERKNYKEQVFLSYMKRHPFYDESIKSNDFIKELNQIQDKDIYEMLDKMPEEWIQKMYPEKDSGEFRRWIGKRLVEKIRDTEVLIDRLQDLKKLKTETEEERKAKTLANKREFERRIRTAASN